MILRLASLFARGGQKPPLPVEPATQPLFGAIDGPEGWLPDRDIENTLASLCALPQPGLQGSDGKLPVERFSRISALLKCLDERNRRSGLATWQSRPRIYTMLRRTGALHLMESFVRNNIYDISLPFDMETLPAFVLSDGLRTRLLDHQKHVLTDARLLEMRPDGGYPEHIHFETSADDHIVHQKLLGHGGYGSVDSVFSKLSLQFYARKRTYRGKDSVVSRCAQQYLIQEIDLMRKFSHRHLVSIMGSYTDPKYVAYLMQPIAECNLEDFLTRRRVEFSDYMTLRQFFGCLAGAINYLHRNHVRHRDLKPHNILVKRSQVYIADFGAAFEWSKQATTQDRHAPKTLFYMAPEIDDRAPRNAASDMWSLGIIFLEMLTCLRGVTVKSWRDFLAREARVARKEGLPCRNIPALNAWLDHLQHVHPSLIDTPGIDSEPLLWTKSLLAAKPEHRPPAQSLAKSIADSPYFHQHCCYDCRQELEDPVYFYRQRPSTSHVEHLTDGELAALIGIEGAKPHVDDQRSRTIHDWIAHTQTEAPMPFIDESPALAVMRQETEGEDIFTSAHTSYFKTRDETKLPALSELDTNPLGFVVQYDSESSDSPRLGAVHTVDEYSDTPFLIINDGSSDSEDDLPPDVSSPAVYEQFELEKIIEDTREEKYDVSAERDRTKAEPKVAVDLGIVRADMVQSADQDSEDLGDETWSWKHEEGPKTLAVGLLPRLDLILEAPNSHVTAELSDLPRITYPESPLEHGHARIDRRRVRFDSVALMDQEPTPEKSTLTTDNIRRLDDAATRKRITYPRKDGDEHVFSATEYIENAWREMEVADSVATSAISESVARKFRGIHIKKFDHDYAWLERRCKAGEAAAVRMLLEQGCNPGTRLKPRPKPLLLAIQGGSARHNKCVRALIAHGCDVNARFHKKTPIHRALERSDFDGHGKLVGMLLAAGAEMNRTDGEGEHALHKIFSLPDGELLQRYRTIALALTLHPRVPIAVDVDARQPVTRNTALHLAVQHDADQAVAILVHHGANADARNASGLTPLLMAANRWTIVGTSGTATMPNEQKSALVHLLRARNVDVEARGGHLMRTALHRAVAAGYPAAVELLLAEGADKSARDRTLMNMEDVLEASKARMSDETFSEIQKLLECDSS